MHKNLPGNDEKRLSRHRPAAIIPDLDMTVLDAFHLARAHSMHLISDGCRIIIAPYIPPGWREVPIRIKNAANQSNAEACCGFQCKECGEWNDGVICETCGHEPAQLPTRVELEAAGQQRLAL